jgi:hypothetical protein
MPRKITVNKGAEPCPKCKNTKQFTVYSSQVAEDFCEIWAECNCGYRPKGGEVEDVWGGTSVDNCYDAIAAWNDAILSLTPLNNQ